MSRYCVSYVYRHAFGVLAPSAGAAKASSNRALSKEIDEADRMCQGSLTSWFMGI